MKVLQTVKEGKTNSMGHVLCRKCHLKHFIAEEIEEKVKAMGRWERRRKQLLNEIKETRIYENWKRKH